MSNSARFGDWFLTASGVKFYPLDPRPEDIRLHDIAHALSNICRFGGHCEPFYSVAQHSIHVARLLWESDSPADAEIATTGLLHDAAEAYIGDMVRPLKIHQPDFQLVEDRLWAFISQKFRLPREMPAVVKTADNVALMTERRDLVIRHPTPWRVTELPDSAGIKPMSPREARHAFLRLYFTLEAFRRDQ